MFDHVHTCVHVIVVRGNTLTPSPASEWFTEEGVITNVCVSARAYIHGCVYRVLPTSIIGATFELIFLGTYVTVHAIALVHKRYTAGSIQAVHFF